MGIEKQKNNDKDRGNERGSGGDNKDGGHNTGKPFGVERVDLIKKLLSVKSEEARLHLEYVDTMDLIVKNLLILAGLLGELRLKKRNEENEELNEFTNRFDLLFDKYMKKI
jgi:hypothetical protein